MTDQSPSDSARPSRAHQWRRTLARAPLRARERAREFTAGGRWTYQLQPEVRRNLRWFWLDGTFANASDSIILAYLAVFVLSLGGTRAQIGLMNSLASLSSAIVLLPGAAIAERLGRRPLVLVGANVARTVMLLLAVIPLFVPPPSIVFVVIGLAVVRSAAVHLGLPGWSSLMADLVPVRWRGRYFSSRSISMVVAGMITTLLFGQIITLLPEPGGYQVALAVAFMIGMGATYSFARIREPEPAATSPGTAGAKRPLLDQLREHRAFIAFCVAAGLWNFGVSLGGPFFSVFLVERLGASAGTIGALAVASSLAALPGHRLFGSLVDRWGARRIQIVTGLTIPVLAIGWALAQATWQVVPLYVVGGFLWAGYGVGSLNTQLALMPPIRRERFSALLQILVLAGAAAGAAIGGVIAQQFGYRVAFFATGAGRLLASILLALTVRVPGPAVVEGDDGPASDHES